MPCTDGGFSPGEERNNLLRSLYQELFKKDYRSSAYWNYESANSAIAKALCKELKTRTPQQIKELSLELQIFWRDHQEQDRLRVQDEQRATLRRKIAMTGLKKLTQAERLALGISMQEDEEE